MYYTRANFCVVAHQITLAERLTVCRALIPHTEYGCKFRLHSYDLHNNDTCYHPTCDY